MMRGDVQGKIREVLTGAKTRGEGALSRGRGSKRKSSGKEILMITGENSRDARPRQEGTGRVDPAWPRLTTAKRGRQNRLRQGIVAAANGEDWRECLMSGTCWSIGGKTPGTERKGNNARVE